MKNSPKKMTESLDYTILSSSILHREQTFSDLKALLSCNICKLPNYLYLYECGHCVCTLCHRGGRTVSACCGGKARIFGLNGMVRYFGECVKEMDS